MVSITNIKSNILKVVKSRTFLRLLPGLAILAPLILIALLVPYLHLQDPITANPAIGQQPPSLEHFFGTDIQGMDIFSRVLNATRLDFFMALLTVLIATGIGVPLGVVAGYFGGIFETIIERLAEGFQSFPLMLFAIIMQVILGSSVVSLPWVIGIRMAPFYAKLGRSIVKPLRDIDYIQAAKVSGQTSPQIIFRHLMPNAIPAIISQFALSGAAAIRTLSGLSFLGLGISIPTPEWGSMIQIGAGWMLFGKWWSSFFPGLALFLGVWGLTSISGEIESMFTLQEK